MVDEGTKTVYGRIVQIIPPIEHDHYLIDRRLRESAREKYLMIIVPKEMPSHFGLQRIRWCWKHCHDGLSQILVMDECPYTEGEIVTIPVVPFYPAVNVWTPVSFHRQ